MSYNLLMQKLRQLMPILTALPAFTEAARLNSFTRAGRDLGIAQPSVSRYVANLENHLGTELFERRHNRLRLTPEGEKLFHATSTGLGEIGRICEEIRSTDTGSLSIECTYGFAHMWLLPRIQSLQEMLPGWTLRTISSESGSSWADSDADLVVCLGDGAWEQESLLLFQEEVFPVVSPAFAETHDLSAEPVDIGGLRKLPLIVQDHGERGWPGWAQWFAHFGLKFQLPEDSHVLNHYALSLQAAMEGKGVALAWDQLDNPFLDNGWLREIPGLRARTGNGYYLIFRRYPGLAESFRAWLGLLNAG